MHLTKNTPWLKELLATHQPPCVSVYLPLLTTPPAAENNRRYRAQIDRARESLDRGYPERTVREIVEKLQAVPSHEQLWTADREAIAVFATSGSVHVIDLHRPVEPAVFVGDHFHIKPLIRLLQSAWQYHVLTFTQRQVLMYRGTGETRLERLDSHLLPQSPDVVSGMRMSHQVSSAADLASAASQFPNEGTGAAPVTLETFMRAVDKAVWEGFSRDDGLPLILCAIEHYHSQFHAVSKNTHLLEAGIKHDPQHLPPDRLRQEAWAIMEPRFRAEVDRIVNSYRVAQAHEKGSSELIPVIEAATLGRIRTLLVDESRQISGRLDRESGSLQAADLEDPRANDVLDDLAEMVLQTEGEVLVLPPELMPGDAGLAAIYRY